MRNGKIETMRFLFAMAILGYHVQLDCWDTPRQLIKSFYLLPYGKLGVEFFFLLSGFLMARSIEAKTPKGPAEELGEESLRYLWRKVKAILPYHLTFCTLTCIFHMFGKKSLSKAFEFLLNSLPSFLLLHSTGLVPKDGQLITPEWYLSSMLLSILILYPICRKFSKTFPYTIAPVIGFLGIGYLLYSHEGLPGNIKTWDGLILSCNIRSFCDLCLGIWCFVLCHILSKAVLSRRMEHILQILEVICYMISFLLMFRFGQEVNQRILLLLMIAVTISFSPYGFGNHSRFFQNRFCLFLGKISLPIYLSQNLIRDLGRLICASLRPGLHFVSVCIVTVLLSCLSVLIWEKVQDRQAKRII